MRTPVSATTTDHIVRRPDRSGIWSEFEWDSGLSDQRLLIGLPKDVAEELELTFSANQHFRLRFEWRQWS